MIGRITNQMSSSMTLAGIESALDRLDTTQQELATGKRINQPSDDPSGTSLTLQLNTQLSNLNTYSNNVTDGTGWAQASSSAMTDVTNAVQRIRELTLEASNGTQSTADMQASAQEVNQLIDEIKQDANTQYNGQYVFSGSATSTAPYQSGSNDAYAGNSGTISRQIGPGTSLAVNANLGSVLGSGQTTPGQPAGDGGLLNTLRNISDAMQSGDSSSLNSDLTSLDTNFNTLTGLGGADRGGPGPSTDGRHPDPDAPDERHAGPLQHPGRRHGVHRNQLLDPAGGADRGPSGRRPASSSSR